MSSVHYERQLQLDVLGHVASDSGWLEKRGKMTQRIEQLICKGWQRHPMSSSDLPRFKHGRKVVELCKRRPVRTEGKVQQ